jgi:hypothetical protein
MKKTWAEKLADSKGLPKVSKIEGALGHWNDGHSGAHRGG